MSASPVVLVLAAGLGTRMKSERSKVLHPVAGRPLVMWAVENARAAGASRVVAILGHQLEQVKQALDARYGEGTVAVAHQAEQKGTGHAVRCALPALANEADDLIVVIVSGDAPLLLPERVSELAAACGRAESGMALLSTRPSIPMPYGRLLRDASGTLLRIVEEVDASPSERAIDELNAGFYAVRLGHLRRDVERLAANNAKGELYLTDLAAAAAARGGAAVIEAPFDEVSGINDRVDLAAVEAAARRRINQRWMREGVSFLAPDQVFIDADVGPIGRDTVIGPGVQLRGRTRIGAGVRIECGAVLDDVTVADGAWLKPYTVASESTIGERAQIGPFAHLRPGTTLEADVRVGNFVETKKAHFGAGAKANHLSYLGDVSVGARANIGAGTITCNYDGFNKHKTVIEAGAFIGSDSQLVAPVTVGRDAYVGSGTTVTKDVPRSSLALSRTKQVNVEGWADRFREAQAKRKAGRGDKGE
jgi:bifunctional UDP-N-acetylglucosamine pyrophosphorylase/glucosamine-1-phosphate N-acetyltransferase